MKNDIRTPLVISLPSMALKHTLQWSARPNMYVPDSDLPSNTTRHQVQTVDGPLELLVVEPHVTRREQVLFFQHGAFGCASVWIPYATYFSQLGYPCYAISVRGHGASWVPGILKMWCASKATIVRDMVAGIEWAKAEEMRKRGTTSVSLVLVGHSMGGGLAQYALSKELVRVTGLILCGTTPGSGMIRCFGNMALVDPLVVPRVLFHGLHPRAMLLTTTHVRRLFFSPQFPDDKLEEFTKCLAESESWAWQLGMMLKFIDFNRVVRRSIVGWGSGKTDGERILMLGGEGDVLMDVAMVHRLARRYRKTVRDSEGAQEIGRAGEVGYDTETYTEDREDGVRVVILKGAGHHFQNDLQWEVGAQRVVDFLQQL